MHVLTLFLLLLLCHPVLAEETPLSQVLTVENTVVTVLGQTYTRDGARVYLKENSGAGVIIDPSGIIATNTHIIYGSNVIKVILASGESLNATVPYVSREYDFSLLKVAFPSPLPCVNWAPPGHLVLGAPVMTIGHSPLLERTISGGELIGMGTRTLEDGSVTPEVLELNINHYPGDSGGPVFDNDGHFVGMISAKRLSQQRALLAIPAEKIREAFLQIK